MKPAIEWAAKIPQDTSTFHSVWVVATQTHGDHHPDIDGIYLTEDDARSAAKDENQFIALVPIGLPIPKNATDAEVLYYPNLETWEQSKLYKQRYPDRAGV